MAIHKVVQKVEKLVSEMHNQRTIGGGIVSTMLSQRTIGGGVASTTSRSPMKIEAINDFDFQSASRLSSATAMLLSSSLFQGLLAFSNLYNLGKLGLPKEIYLRHYNYSKRQ